MTQRLEYARVAPGGLKALLGLHTYVTQSGLPTDLLDFVYLRVSQMNGCAYCIDMHSHDLLKHGVATEKIMLVAGWREADQMFTDRERAALAWAETVTRVTDTHVPDDAYEAVSVAFTEKERVDLTYAIGLINAFNRLGVAFRARPASVKT